MPDRSLTLEREKATVRYETKAMVLKTTAAAKRLMGRLDDTQYLLEFGGDCEEYDAAVVSAETKM